MPSDKVKDKGFRFPGDLKKRHYRGPLKRLVVELEEQYKRDIVDFKHQFKKWSNTHEQFREDTEQYLVVLSLGLDPNEVRLPRYVPVRIYLSGPESSSIAVTKSRALHRELSYVVYRVYGATKDLLENLDLTIVQDPPAVEGSWWKQLLTKTKDAATLPEVQERLQKAERAIEMHVLLKQQSDVDKNQAEAVSGLIKALADVQNAALQIGSLLVIKRSNAEGKSEIVSRTLTQNELILIEKNPDVLCDPENVINVLNGETAKTARRSKKGQTRLNY